MRREVREVREVVALSVEVLEGEAEPEVPVWLVIGYRGLDPLSVVLCDDGAFRTLMRVHDCPARLPEHMAAGDWPPLPALLRRLFPEYCQGRVS